ncbi:glycoside hydrolase domain-containing protein [Verrucosispora sp. WMMD573]|uniref:glycoside hydrolase domain-containing protein n=1 Tax=Verrucosispora sp. WMMD573 TaxID=3015149 RepID=UPI00248C1EEE|nr:glycoside hydrolase domain-containing protein [Verrucosispora sp. WMMD573]WBB55485.1 DUF1906 domain-containing protein [Verrucosispora sp. WMMD573]
MDEMVLRAQQWVNATYASVPGYVRTAENGVTGWGIAFALTRALQHELGITELSDNFGPTTFSRLSQYGEVGISSTNMNMRTIVEAALYCKGYSGGGIDGAFNTNTLSGLTALVNNMGLHVGYVTGVTPKVFKALLTMDAYVLLSGGDAYVQQIQRWLNRSYGHRRDFYYGPCDGYFSRDVQKGLILAIQYELGMADGVANGNVGPGTKAGLQSQAYVRQGSVDSGDTGFVRLFQAALTFNGYDGHWSSSEGTFDSRIEFAVKHFQEFVKLPQSGAGDYQTWMSLLLSTGDPDRRGTAMDCMYPLNSATIASVRAAGYKYVGRYLNGGTNKRLTHSEIALIFDNGMSIFPLYQEWGDAVHHFSYSQGYQAGLEACASAREFGIPYGTVIYFSVDFDALDSEITSAVAPHFRGVRDAVAEDGNRYAIGVYGCRNVCRRLAALGLTTRSFVSGMSTGYSGNLGFPLPSNWAFDQISNFVLAPGTPGAVEIDNNIVSGLDHGINSVNRERDANDAFYTYLRWLEARAGQWRDQGHTERSAAELVAQYLRYRSRKYDFAGAETTFGAIDKDFVDFAHNYAGRPDKAPLRDPVTFWDSDVEHFGATFGAVLNNTLHDDRTKVSLVDFGGWCGDLLSTLGDMVQSGVSTSDAYDWAVDHIANPSDDSFFTIGDFIADVDAMVLGMQFRAHPTRTLSFEISEIYSDIYRAKARFDSFYSVRFNKNLQTLLGAARSVFYQTSDLLYNVGREAFWNRTFSESTGHQIVGTVPDAYKDACAAGFATVVQRYSDM